VPSLIVPAHDGHSFALNLQVWHTSGLKAGVLTKASLFFLFVNSIVLHCQFENVKAFSRKGKYLHQTHHQF
jgi:hypothetical protein